MLTKYAVLTAREIIREAEYQIGLGRVDPDLVIELVAHLENLTNARSNAAVVQSS